MRGEIFTLFHVLVRSRGRIGSHRWTQLEILRIILIFVAFRNLHERHLRHSHILRLVTLNVWIHLILCPCRWYIICHVQRDKAENAKSKWWLLNDSLRDHHDGAENIKEANLGSAGRAGLRDRMEVEGPAGVGFTLTRKRFICFASTVEHVRFDFFFITNNFYCNNTKTY